MSIYHVRKYVNQKAVPKPDVTASSLDSALQLARARFGHNIEVFGPHGSDCPCHTAVSTITYLTGELAGLVLLLTGDLNHIPYLYSGSVQ